MYSEREQEREKASLGEFAPRRLMCRNLREQVAPNKVRKAEDAVLTFFQTASDVPGRMCQSSG